MKGTFTCRPRHRAASNGAARSARPWASATPRRWSRSTVDEATGEVRVERVWTALDCGYAINPLAVEGQIQGSVWMGMGQALSEETRYLDGLPAHANLLEYRVPTIAESPPIEVQIVESHDPQRAIRRQGGERRRAAGFPPALVNAVANAIGIDIDELPVTPDRVMQALVERRRRDAARRMQKAAS